jgi:hypothetical protein
MPLPTRLNPKERMGKASHGPTIPESAKAQGSINGGGQINSTVKRELDTPPRNILQMDGRFVTTSGNKRVDY